MLSQQASFGYLGRGGFSKVYYEKHDEKTYACKKIQLPLGFSINYLFDELNALRCLQHPNLLKCFGFRMASFSSFDILLEYIKGQTLDFKYKEHNEEMLFYWIFQISLALIQLNQKGIVHRDLKPKNILVDSNGLIKIVDFGIAKVLHNNFSNLVGSPSYIAPEVITHNHVFSESDVWSLGITIYQLIHKKLPFGFPINKTLQQRMRIFEKICNQKIQISEGVCSPEMKSLLESMLQINPKFRITPYGILKHEAIKAREQVFARNYGYALEQALYQE